MSVRKIFITGGPGSGKTTLSRSVGSSLGVPVCDLDAMLWESQIRGEPFEVAVSGSVSKIMAMDAWVAEGMYRGWADPLLRQAEFVLWLDVPWRKASYRIISRHIKATLARNNHFPGLRRLHRFWRWSGRFYSNQNPSGLNQFGVAETKSEAVRYPAQYEDKVLDCQTQMGIDALNQEFGIHI
jgi:adenylate kinase family enzyme